MDYKNLINEINLNGKKLEFLSQEELIDAAEKVKRKISLENEIGKQTLQETIVDTFALVREVSWRTLGLKHFSTQLMGGLILNEGKIVEMKTGEGKTLVSTLPAYYNAALKKGVHIITVNEYLAERDQKWMGEIYRFLDSSVGLVKEQMTEKEKKLNYNADITYLTNTELGFDYLRDNLAISTNQIVQRPFYYGIIDEVDSILIDEARTPLIISGKSDAYSLDKYIQAAEVACFLELNKDFIIFERERSIQLTEEGILKTQKILKIKNLFDITEPWVTYVLNALKVKVFFLKDTNYIVENNKIVSVDEFTGRVMPNRQWNEGIQQAIEAKENVPLSDMNQTIASITYQNLFLLYPKLAGMTGTAKTAEIELDEIYNIEIEVLPTAKPIKRKDLKDFVYIDELSKWKGVIKECFEMQKIGRPILIGTTNIEKSELLSELLKDYDIKHNVLNAKPKNAKSEAEIISQAGRLNSITIATNMAGRGADIPLGGDAKILAIKHLQNLLNGHKVKHKKITKNFLNKLVRTNTKLKASAKPVLLNNKKKIFELSCKPLKKERLIDKNFVFPTFNLRSKYKINKKFDIETHLFDLRQIPINYIIRSKLNQTNQFNLLLEWIYLQLFKKYTKITDIEKNVVCNLGGLYVIGTERHDSIRIDNQLRGRAGRQGEPGTSRFFISLDDNLLRIFGDDKIKNQLQRWVTLEPSVPLESNFLDSSITAAQKKVEDFYYESRKNLFKYDEILDSQRLAIFTERRKGLFNKNVRSWILTYTESLIDDLANQISTTQVDINTLFLLTVYLNLQFNLSYKEIFLLLDNKSLNYSEINEFLRKQLWKTYDLIEAYTEIYYPKKIRLIEKTIILRNIDKNWKYHLRQMLFLKTAIGWRSYGQVDPLIEYKNEAFTLFDITLTNIKYGVAKEIFNFLDDI